MMSPADLRVSERLGPDWSEAFASSSPHRGSAIPPELALRRSTDHGGRRVTSQFPTSPRSSPPGLMSVFTGCRWW